MAYRTVTLWKTLILTAALVVSIQSPLLALDESNVLVLYNSASSEGQQIANYYGQVHSGVNTLALTGVSTAEQITADDYLTTLRPQVLSYLNAPGAPDIQVIVTTKGMPLRIQNTHANPGTYAGWRGSLFGVDISDDWWESYSSLESELTRVQDIGSWEQMGDQAHFMGPPDPFWGQVFPTHHQASNPYYNNQGASFDSSSYEGMYLTSRLDGFTVADVTASVDRAQQATLATIVLDDDIDAIAGAIDRMPALRDMLANWRFNGGVQANVYENSDNAVTDDPALVGGYVSHGVNDGTGGLTTGYIADQLDFDLADGAVFQTYESYNAYSFEPGGGLAGQALIAEWLAAGGTAGVGHVQEPGASPATVANEDILFEMLLGGYTWAEAAWASMAQLSFVNTVVGDPLMTWSRKPGDMNGDGLVTARDIDHLNTFLTGPGVPVADARYDLDGDGDADFDDVNMLVTVILGTIFGDYDLNLQVNAGDLSILTDTFGATTLGWAFGDANGDMSVDAMDLAILGANFGFMSAGGAEQQVPEPATLGLLAIGFAAILRRRR